METPRPNTRRNFLLAASLGAAGVVAAATAAHIRPQAAAATAPDATAIPGYRASPHILTYYKTAAF